MKQLYFIALAAAVAVSASAASVPSLRTASDFSGKKLMTKSEAAAKYRSALRQDVSSLPHKAARKAPVTTADVTGDYIFTFGDYYFEDSTGDFTSEVKVTGTNGNLVFNSDEVPGFTGTLDEASGEITFTQYEFGARTVSGKQYYVRCEPFVYDWDIDDLAPQEIYGTFADNKIIFDEENGLSWVAYTDASYEDFAGYIYIYNLIDASKIVEPEDPNEGWKSIGNATFEDPWIVPLYQATDPSITNGYEVELQQNESNENLYRLVNPYKGNCPVAAWNVSTSTGYITFDVTDPDHVVFTGTEAGFANDQLKITKFYPYNNLHIFMNFLGSDDIEYVVGILEASNINCCFTTFKDGVVDLTSYTDGASGIVYDACFGRQGDINGGYSWDENVKMAGRIIFPNEDIPNAVGSISSESNAPARYFNLQGLEVAEPAAGQIVIRKQGNKTSKQIF